MKITVFTVVFLLTVGFALAADIDGTWSGEYAGGMDGQPMTLTYTFKADGSTLTGTSLAGPNGETVPIKDGKIDGNKISFVVVVDFGGSEMKFNYKGILSGDEIKLSFDIGMGDPGMGGPPQEFTVKRVK